MAAGESRPLYQAMRSNDRLKARQRSATSLRVMVLLRGSLLAMGARLDPTWRFPTSPPAAADRDTAEAAAWPH